MNIIRQGKHFINAARRLFPPYFWQDFPQNPGCATITVNLKTSKRKTSNTKTLKCKVKVKPAATTPTPENPDDNKPSTPVTEGVAIENHIPEHENTVLVTDNAVIKITFAKDGVPAANTEVVFTAKKTGGGNSGNYGILQNTVTTDANGVATIMFGNKNNANIVASDAGYIAAFDFTATTLGSAPVTQKGSVQFAAVGVRELVNINNNAENKDEAYKKLKVSANINNKSADGITSTYATFTHHQSGGYIKTVAENEFVDSQQVGNQVGFTGGYPEIVVPTVTSDYQAALRGSQNVNFKSGSYSTYESKSHVEELEVNPKELTYATLKFDSLDLSKYTSFKVTAYSNKEDAETGKNPINEYTKEYFGQLSQGTFDYQIPLSNCTYNKLFFRTELVSKGRVNTAHNNGYYWNKIDYVYKTRSTVNGTAIPIKGATVKWDAKDLPWDLETPLKAGDITTLNSNNSSNGVDLITNVAKATYKVPSFPYTGNAVITTYDKNNKVLNYYACPTVNDYGSKIDSTNSSIQYANRNVLDLTTDSCYQISAEEAVRAGAAKVSQSESGDTVTVNSEQAGYTALEGVILYNGESIEGKYPGFDATNSTVYTSVQWNPTKAGSTNIGLIGLKGQNITVVAKLVDKFGNEVSTKGVPVQFAYSTAAVGSYSRISEDTETDVNGEARLVLNAADVTELLDVSAETRNTGTGYEIRLKSADGKTSGTNKADVYWVDANLSYENSVEKDSTYEKVVTGVSGLDSMQTSDSLNTALVGEKWDYAVETVGTELKNGVYKAKKVSIINLPVNTTAGVNSIGNITPYTDAYGKAAITSSKVGTANIINRILPTSSTLASNVKFNVDGFGEIQSSGSGSTTINKTLIINVKWQRDGEQITMYTKSGTRANIGNAKLVYVEYADKLGNPISGASIKFNATGDAQIAAANVTQDASGANIGYANSLDYKTGDVNTIIAKTDKNGIAAVWVANYANNNAGTVRAVKLKDDGTEDNAMTAQQVVYWNPASATAVLKLDESTDQNTGVFLSRYIGDGKILLTFTEELDRDSVNINTFSVAYDPNNSGTASPYVIKGYSISGRQITLETEIPNNIPADAPIKVTVEPTIINSVNYQLTSVNGGEIAVKQEYTVTKTTAPIITDMP